MKKSLLLVLPALLVLSACQSAPKAKENPNLFIEDTLMHEELFGQNDFVKIDTRVRNLDPLDSSLPMIGVQTAPGSVADTTSIRFVAAVNLDLENLADVHPVWTRVLYEEDGDGTLKASDTLESTKAYTSINSGGDPILPSSFGSYNRFVVYTMMNIPNTYSDCYFNVSLNLAGVPSKVLATTVDLSSHFTFNSSSENIFLTGTIGGVAGDLAQDGSTRGSNAASFTTNLQENDSFIIVQRTSSLFKTWTATNLGDEGDGFAKDSGKIKVTASKKYVVYLNTSNGIYHTQYEKPTGYYIRGDAANGWGVGDLINDYQFITDPDNKGILLGVHLNAGEFKIGDSTWAHEWSFYSCKDGGDYFYPNDGNEYNSIFIGGAKDHFEGTSNHGVVNTRCKDAGTYNFYLTNNFYVSVELVSLD